MTRNVRLVVEYDGSSLSGWQRQDNGPTVQAHIEDCLAEIVGQHVVITGASRTDAGVHALGQVCNFPCEHPSIPAHGIRKALNSALPPNIAIIAADEAPASFHARFASTGKHYRYRILNRRDRAPLRRQTWHVPYPLDVAAMRQAAETLIGEHDFSAFRAADCGAKTAIRRVTAIDIARDDDEIRIDVRGNAFLRNMVRIVVGTLVEVGGGRRPATEIAGLLAGRDRRQAGRTAPGFGLTLVEVFYPPTGG